MNSAGFQLQVRRDGAAGGVIAVAKQRSAGARRPGARPARATGRWTTWAIHALAAPLLAVLTVLAACGGGGGDNEAATSSSVTAASPLAGETRVSTLALATGPARDPATDTPAVWTPCASEGQTCAFSGVKQVRYGALSSYVTLTLSGGTACSNAVFGDPLNGTVKSCAVADVDPAAGFTPADWVLCAAEGGSCVFDSSRQVRYGTPSQAVTQLFAAGPAACSNAVFGDPAYGIAKSCWYAAQPSVAPTWTACAAENQHCSFSGTRAVRYGTATAFVTVTYTSGVDCSNAVFGDPAFGIVKACSYSSVDSGAGGASAPTPAPAPTPTPTPAPTPAPVATVTLPAVTATAMGATTQLVATVVNAAGAAVPGATIAWTIADPTIATLGAGGLVTPLRPGFSTVTASTGGKQASGVLTVRGPTPIPTRSQYVGTNLGGLAYYGSNFPFANLMKSGSGWDSDNGNAFPSTSADGYPTSLAPGQHAHTAVAWNNTHYPAGQYTLLWDGDGTVNFPWGNVKIDSNAPNRMVVEPTDLTQAIVIGIDATNPANPVRNVRFLWPGTEATYAAQPFNPVYLAKIAPFSVLRFMDWGATNGSPLVEWADRPLPTNVAYTTSKGVPIEVMIDLANSLHVDPWFCIPHMASDDYVRQFGALLHSRLDPTLRPHIEYSNEVWNTGFSQTTWASAQSDALGLQRPWGTPSIFYAQRSVQMFKLLQQAYGSADAHRLVRVLSGQSAWTQFLQNALGSADTAANVDVMAIAPYFSADSADDTANLTATLALSPSQIVDQMLVSIRGNIKSQMTSNAALAAQYHLKMKAYESGPGDSAGYFPAANQDALTALFIAANVNPRMKDLYTEYYSQWKAVGGDTMNQYTDIGGWSKWGFWGALQNVTDDVTSSPKYQGLMSVIAANPTAAQETTLKATTGSRK